MERLVCYSRPHGRSIIVKTQKYWNKQAKEYDFYEHRFDRIYSQILAKTKSFLKPGHKVLDFGCATGTKALELAGSAGEILGLDFSSEMIKKAKKKCSHANIENAQFKEGTIFSNELAAASFDTIVAFGILHQLDDKEQVLSRIHELLRPGGLFISTTACMKDSMSFEARFEFTLSRFLTFFKLFPLHLNMFTAANVAGLIKNSSFEIVEEEVLFQGITISFIIARKANEIEG